MSAGVEMQQPEISLKSPLFYTPRGHRFWRVTQNP